MEEEEYSKQKEEQRQKFQYESGLGMLQEQQGADEPKQSWYRWGKAREELEKGKWHRDGPLDRHKDLLFFFFFFSFLGLQLQHMEVPRLGAESEL